MLVIHCQIEKLVFNLLGLSLFYRIVSRPKGKGGKDFFDIEMAFKKDRDVPDDRERTSPSVFKHWEDLVPDLIQ